MPLPELLLFVMSIVATGWLAGLTAGMFGIGGGTVIVPCMALLFKLAGTPPDMAMHLAIGTSLATIIPTSVVSFRAHAKHGKADIATLRHWGFAIVMGAVAGGTLAGYLSGNFLKISFGIFSLIIAIYMGLPATKQSVKSQPTQNWVQQIIAGTIGFIAALVGVGGGSMAVPAMVMSGVSIHRAVGTASGFGLLVALPATIAFMLPAAPGENLPFGTIGHVSWLAFVFLAPATMLAAPYGARWAHRLPATTLRRIFAVFIFLIAIKMLDPYSI